MRKCLATVCDKAFLIGCKVMIKSFLDNNHWFNYDIIIITDDLDAPDIESLQDLYSKISIVTADKHSLKDNFSEQMLKTYMKFQVFDLPFDQIVFIDSDCIVLQDIEYLFKIEAKFSACPELSLSLKRDDGKPQFNTGVMVINKLAKFVPLYRSSEFYNKHLMHSEFNHHGDQTILNIAIDECNYIDPFYNTLKTTYRHYGSWINNVKILHYVAKKPWEWFKPYHFSGNREFTQIEKIWWSFYLNSFEPEVLPTKEDLLLYVRDLGTKTTAEVGVFKGEFSQSILDIVQPIHHVCIDPWVNQENYPDAVNHEDLGKVYTDVKQRFGGRKDCTIVRTYGSIAAKKINSSFEFVYLDAKHDKDSVTKDILDWYPKICEGGVLAGHDYMDGTLFINGHETVFGVKSAVDDFAKKNNLKVRYTLEDNFRSWWIKI